MNKDREAMRVLRSKYDASVNFVEDVDEGQALEARYVRRYPEYIACYISSQTACAQACRMCHLTATGQNKPRDASVEEMLSQAKKVLNHYSFGIPRQEDAKGVHFNFMSRGEPLSSEVIARRGENLFLKLGEIAYDHGLKPRYLISTIMPESRDESLIEMFPTVHPEIYYSLYSMDPEFRRRWLPRAADPNEALDDLAAWQYHTKKVIKIHFALIEGLNDTPRECASDNRCCERSGLEGGLRTGALQPTHRGPWQRSSRLVGQAVCGGSGETSPVPAKGQGGGPGRS